MFFIFKKILYLSVISPETQNRHVAIGPKYVKKKYRDFT